jgi:hypothetical protein
MTGGGTAFRFTFLLSSPISAHPNNHVLCIIFCETGNVYLSQSSTSLFFQQPVEFLPTYLCSESIPEGPGVTIFVECYTTREDG